MKTAFAWFTALLATFAIAQEPDDRVVLVPLGKAPKELPLFFSAAAEVKARVGLESVTTAQQLDFKIQQGKPETLTLSLGGQGEVLSVTGEGLRDWSVRVGDGGSRFLDIRPLIVAEKPLTDLRVQLTSQQKIAGGPVGLLLPGPGGASAFSLNVEVTAESGVDLKFGKTEGLTPVADSEGRKFIGTGSASLELTASMGGPASRGLELTNTALTGRLTPDGGSISFKMTSTAHALAAGSATELFGGGAALSSAASGDGWHAALRDNDSAHGYDLIAERSGEFPLEIEFVVPVTRKGDWRLLDFHLPSGVVVPVRIEGFGKTVSFDRSLPLVPEPDGEAWRGFLPANGDASLAWRDSGAVADGALFFSSSEATDVRIGSGLMRQLTTVDIRVLQGRLPELAFSLDGPGEVLAVTGAPVLGWSVVTENGRRELKVKLNQAIEGSGQVIIEAQATLGGFPVKSEALRMIPLGSLRHSGWLRLANEGAVRIEVADAKGLIQLAPSQFPGRIEENPRQLFVYRFPSADYGYAILADQVLPEVSVTEVTVYDLAETDRRITTDLELDIREAPLREWELEIPADYAVASATGPEVADYVVASETKEGRRRLKIIFEDAVENRQLVSVRLEKNDAAKAGAWELQPLEYPGVKSRRGYIGAVAAAGYRLVAGKNSGVAEVPVTFFPKKTAGLQQAFRLRDGAWQLGLTVEALGQSVQADVFHLYSLKAGAAYGSVLINYFVVGAPATEWRVAVPPGVGNIEVTGQNVGRDARREGETMIIPLSRPVLGTGTVLLTFEQPMSARGGDLTPGEVHPLNVQAERGYVQVVSPLQVKFDKRGEGSLLEIDSSELPAEFRVLSSAPTLAAWQYTARDFKIWMKIEWFDPGETVAQVVDFLKLSSQVSRDGQWVTDARFFVKSRGLGALRATLPAGAQLWEAKVDGAAVNAREDGKETLIPLPTQVDPNKAAEVSLRYGARSESPTRLRLGAPKLAAPLVIGEWVISGDEGRQLVPHGGTAELVRPVLAESGWRWLATHSGRVGGLLLLGIGMMLLSSGNPSGMRRGLALLLGAAFIVTACVFGFSAAAGSHGNAAVLEYAAPVVAAGGEVAVEIGNVAPWQARTGWGMWVFLFVGLPLACYGLLGGGRWWKGLGIGLIGAALLSIHGGAALFFGALASAALAWWLPRIWQAAHDLQKPKIAEVAAVIALLTIFGFGESRAAELPGLKPAESMIHDWQIRDGRLRGTLDVTLRGEAGDRFLLLRGPAVLSEFEGAGLHVVKGPLAGAEAYFLVADSTGKLTGRARFEMPLADPGKGWELPSGPAAMRRLTLRWDQSGWEFSSPGAAMVTTPADLAATESGATVVLGSADPVTIFARLKQRDVATEEIRFFAEVSNLFLPVPGVVGGRHRVSIRPAQGRVSTLVMKVPDGFTVSDVVDGPVGSWRFDPEKHELRVPVEPAQDQAFAFTIETQRGAGALPMDLELAPVRVDGAAGEIGFLALAFGDEAQPESVEVEGLSRVNPEDFNGTLLPRDKEGNPLALLQHAFRYGSGDVRARVKVTAVAPELRADSWQLVSLGEDRLVVATDLTVSITRSGVFRLAVEVPDGLEIEAATGEGLSHWTESNIDGKRVITLHLAGKTMGQRTFSLTMTGRPTGAVKEWQMPRLSLRDASRQAGVVTIVPDRGLQVRAVTRNNVSAIDPRELADAPKDSARAAARPGALAYRLLQSDWSLGLSISRLDPWVTAQVFQEATLREGQMLTRVDIDYKIENAAVKSVRVRIPGLDATAAAMVRASGAAVADLVPVAGEEGLWEIRFQRGVAGETRVELEYQQTSKDEGHALIQPVVLEKVSQLTYYAMIRAGGRLELEYGALPRGWQRSEQRVNSPLGKDAGGSGALITFRVADPEGPLPVILKRHDLANLQKLRVSEGALTTLMSPAGDALTSVDLKMQVVGKETLRLKLPAGAALFNVLVNEEGATLVREGDEWLFYVFPSPEAGMPATVRFVYSAGSGKGSRLEGPVFNVPMENLTWRVLVPEGWKMTGHGGDFDLKEQAAMGTFGLEDYQSFARIKKESDSKSAVALLDQANSWMAAGEQEKASMAFSNAVRTNQLDAASGEDARVQLRELKTRQAVLGLNARRQKLAKDNVGNGVQTDGARDGAAEMNPVLSGDTNYDPKKFDRFLEGNTADENTALKEIANRIVTQQLAAEPAPLALDVTLPERGTVLTFGRSVQVDGKRPMILKLDLKRAGSGIAWLAIPLCVLLGLMGCARWKGRTARLQTR